MAAVGLAGEALVWWLGSDPRVQRAYVAWRVAHGLLPGVTIGPDMQREIVRTKAQDVRMLEQLVHDLGLNYRWLAEALHSDFIATALGLEGVRITPEDVGLPPGRRLKNDGRHIGRDVEWFYRNRIKVPPDTEYFLAKEDQQRKRATGVWIKVNPNVARAGIKRAERLLAVLAVDGNTI
jgi:hypothetical protein